MIDRNATIDGMQVSIHADETVLEAATRVGVTIPTLCKGRDLSPEGGCRLCLVEVEGTSRPQAACHTKLADGMVIRTATDRIESLRRDILDLTLSAHPDQTFDASSPQTEFEELLAQYDLHRSSYPDRAMPATLDQTHPYLRYDPSRCILCRRCIDACESIQGQFVFSIESRGIQSSLCYGDDDSFLDSGCVACGACVDRCPTAAITDIDRIARVKSDRVTRTTCGYCGVGCQIDVRSRDGRITEIGGAKDAVVNRGHLCAKGRYAHAYQSADDRLTQPLLRNGEHLEPVSWDEAIDWVSTRILSIGKRWGPDALGVFTSSRSTNEAAYLLQKMFRGIIGTNNIDCCARVCHSSTALALRTVTGTGAASASYEDIELAKCIVIAGANPTEAHPVVGSRIKQAVLDGAKLIVIDPRRIELAEYATCFLPLRPGTNVALFNAMAKLLIESGQVDVRYLEERVDGWSELEKFVEGLSLEQSAQTCGVAPDRIADAAQILGEVGPALFVHGLGLSELTQGTESVMTLCNLGMLTGSIGKPGAGMLPLRGQNNVQGNADMGAMPNLVTGYQSVQDSGVRERVGSIWNATIPTRPGKTIPEMIDAAAAGEIRGLWIQGEDVAQSDPNETHVRSALNNLELLVVQELFLSETAQYADLVLPAAGALEQDGTFTNGERRIQRVRAAVEPPGQARPDWEVARNVACALGAHWTYSCADDVMTEIAAVAPAIFGGVAFDRLGDDGLQWPCPDRTHPGTRRVHESEFIRGRGQLICVEHIASPEHSVDGFPYLLITGRVLEHYNVGTMTRRTPNRTLRAEDTLEIHVRDAAREGIVDGSRVDIESQWGSTNVVAQVSQRVQPGHVFLSFHFPETHTNRLTGPQRDAKSNCPEYKVTAVRLRTPETQSPPA